MVEHIHLPLLNPQRFVTNLLRIGGSRLFLIIYAYICSAGAFNLLCMRSDMISGTLFPLHLWFKLYNSHKMGLTNNQHPCVVGRFDSSSLEREVPGIRKKEGRDGIHNPPSTDARQFSDQRMTASGVMRSGPFRPARLMPGENVEEDSFG